MAIVLEQCQFNERLEDNGMLKYFGTVSYVLLWCVNSAEYTSLCTLCAHLIMTNKESLSLFIYDNGIFLLVLLVIAT